MTGIFGDTATMKTHFQSFFNSVAHKSRRQKERDG
jgi:hypothetical protein